MVLGVIVILTVFVTQLQQSTSATLSAAIAARDAQRAEYHAKSATNLARLLIGAEPRVRASLQPILHALTGGKIPIKQVPLWKFASTVLGVFNDEEHARGFAAAAGVDLSDPGTTAKNIGLRDGYFELDVVDEDSKINVNAASGGSPLARIRLGAQLLGLTSPPQYEPLFEHPDPDGQISDRMTICGAIVDWSDYDEARYDCNPFGNAPQNDAAEDGVYPALGVPYVRKNAPFDSLDELRLVRGMSDAFWATFVEPDANDPESRALSTWGQQRINVNTANAVTLLAVVCANAPDAPLCSDPIQSETFIEALTLTKTLLGGFPLFVTPRAFLRALLGRGSTPVASIFRALGLEPVKFRAPREVLKILTTESKVFSIYADGTVPGRNRESRVRIHSVVDFRNAAELGATSPAKGPSQDAGTRPTDADVLAALLSDPLGVVVYFRIE